MFLACLLLQFLKSDENPYGGNVANKNKVTHQKSPAVFIIWPHNMDTLSMNSSADVISSDLKIIDVIDLKLLLSDAKEC